MTEKMADQGGIAVASLPWLAIFIWKKLFAAHLTASMRSSVLLPRVLAKVMRSVPVVRSLA